MSNIDIEIERNLELLKKIEKIAIKITIDQNERDILFAGFFRNTLSHYYSINILCKKGIYNSAFALIRIFFEGMVRADYLYKEISDEKINKLYAGNGWGTAFPVFGKMCKKIDSEYNIDFYSKIKDTAYKTMNDYTHTGFNQISRNFNPNEEGIGANFKKELVIDSLVSINNMVGIFSVGYFERIGLKYERIKKQDMEEFMAFIKPIKT